MEAKNQKAMWRREKKNDELEIKFLTFSPEKQLNNSRNKQI